LKRDWLATFLDLSCGIPSHDTFRRVFILLCPTAFQHCFMRWVQAIARLKPGEVIAVDGKTLRRSYDRWSGRAAIEMVSAWASSAGLVLAQRQVAEGSNEIATVPEILQQLVLKGCMVTADAAHCQTQHARIVVERGGDYVFALKGNQGQLYDEVSAMVAHEAPSDYRAVKHERWAERSKAHGRIETRRYVLVTDPEYVAYFNRKEAWWQLGAIGIVERTRQMGDRVERSQAFFITSLKGDVKRFARAVRRYWSIENNLHWTLDVIFQEDLSRARVGFEAANFAVVRRFTLNLLKLEKTAKDSLAWI
ncbi:MAG: ISAs1 family transposase, partial [Thermoflexales bacterium]|nr:ISAs1 family transposase [Thermoflexales bacterium]